MPLMMSLKKKRAMKWQRGVTILGKRRMVSPRRQKCQKTYKTFKSGETNTDDLSPAQDA